MAARLKQGAMHVLGCPFQANCHRNSTHAPPFQNPTRILQRMHRYPLPSDTCVPYAVATNPSKSLTRSNMADNELEILTNARAVLVEVRHNFAKTIAAGYKRGETETAIKSILEVQQALDVIDHAAEELEEAEDEGDDDEE
jgi:hypothetical protein